MVAITPTSPPSHDSAGPLLCGLLSSPDVLLCHVRDWRDPAEAQANASCPGVTYDQDSRQVTLRLGGQEIGGKYLLSLRVHSFTVIYAHQQGLLLCWEPSLYPEEFILLKRICTKMLHKKQPESISAVLREKRGAALGPQVGSGRLSGMAALTLAMLAHILGSLGSWMMSFGLDGGGLALLQCLAF